MTTRLRRARFTWVSYEDFKPGANLADIYPNFIKIEEAKDLTEGWYLMEFESLFKFEADLYDKNEPPVDEAYYNDGSWFWNLGDIKQNEAVESKVVSDMKIHRYFK